MKNLQKKHSIAALVLIVIAVIGFFGILNSSSGSSSGYYSSGNGYRSGSSYGNSFTCYKCHNKGYYECDTCHGTGRISKYYNTPNYSGTGSYVSSSVKVDCPDCVDGVADCRACYN